MFLPLTGWFCDCYGAWFALKVLRLGNKGDEAALARVLKRSRTSIEKAKSVALPVIEEVRELGDEAVLNYSLKFDGVRMNSSQLRVSRKEIQKAYAEVSPVFLKAVKKQVSYAKEFAELQLKHSNKKWKATLSSGVVAGQFATPLESAGIYVPGGTAPYPTVMQILGVAAKTAGVKKVVACTPPKAARPEVLVAADLAGVDEVYKVGGVQAIAAMAFGTKTVPKVSKICGPGNVFVTAAKLLVFGEVAVDMPGGPSEAIIVADGGADASFVASDILARCEHDANAAGVLVTTSEEFAKQVLVEVEVQRKFLSRGEIIEKSLLGFSAIVVAKDLDEAAFFSNDYAPEHLQVSVREPWEFLEKITNAGSVFLGDYAPVAVGDYASGVNHVLPTSQYAKMFSGVGVESFLKKTEFEYVSKESLKKLYDEVVECIADVEGFDGHKNSVKIRVDKK
ncbi:MAG: histidinol dehydrogenase [Candidatus Micrarchaeia archaeon]